ncbi:hypothetical protein R6Q57_009929, partial [Mikania cordata]
NNGASSSGSNIRSSLLGMGFMPDLVDKAIRQNGEDNMDLLLGTLFAYSHANGSYLDKNEDSAQGSGKRKPRPEHFFFTETTIATATRNTRPVTQPPPEKQPPETSKQDAFEGSQTVVDRLSKEEWQALNNLLSFQPDEDFASQSGKEMQNMTQRMVIVSIGQAAAKIININETEVVCGRFEQLQISSKFKHRSIYCDMTLKFYGLSAPEGPLCQV